MAEKFQAVVIGGGPGGYVCAIRLSQLGLKTACIESRGSLGGTCLNIGCIPSKSLLNLSEEFHKVKSLANKGIEVGDVKLNLDKMMKSKDKAVTVLTKGVEFLFKKNKVTYFKGYASFKSKNEILIKDNENKDPGEIIIDELIGQSVPIFAYEISHGIEKSSDEAFIFYCICFVLFRFFDIVKPFPVSFFDKNFKNSFGVIMDDVCAGLYVILALICFMIISSYFI